MILYRAIAHNKDIKLNRLGIHFSLSPSSAYPYGNKTDLNYYYLYVCEVEESAINKELTTQKNFVYPHEKEVVLWPGKEINVIQVIELTRTIQSIKEIHFINFKTKS